MPQKTQKFLPVYINTDISFENMPQTDAAFIKGLSSNINENPDLGTGTNNPTNTGQNATVLTPVVSNVEVEKELLPAGYNKNAGSFESIVTHEMYSLYFNENGKYSIYVTNGDTGITNKVVQDVELQFTDDQDGFMAPHRVSLRPILNTLGEVIEKILLITDGKSWQKWILVNTGIATNGYDFSLFPYFTPLAPHFDRREVLEWATRPVMYNPIAVTVPNTVADKGKVNRLVDSAFQYAVAVNYTDGRPTTLSPYSLPVIVKGTDFLNNPDNLPKNIKVTIYAGGVWVESLDIYVRQSKKQDAGIPSQIIWDDWQWIDRIYKFGNTPHVIETPFWTRTNPWANNNYDTVFNTIEYNFDNYKLGLPPLIDVSLYENDLPQLSVGHCQLADCEALANNRYGYDNLSSTQLANLDVIVKEKPQVLCLTPLRTVYLYAYLGQCGADFTYISQVGYTFGEGDTQVRFGGMRQQGGNEMLVDPNESKFYNLDFADKKALRVYLKGTPYYADGEWCIVRPDNSIVVLDATYDFSIAAQRAVAKTVIATDNSYYMCRFKLKIPAGKYIATIGRHNVASAGDYRGTSTYIYGLANSRAKVTKINNYGRYTAVQPNALVSYSKEMELDCTAGDIDVWGNNKDLFYIYSPYNHFFDGGGHFRFIEGYLHESGGSSVPVEQFPYYMTRNAADDWGKFTDKNGFYWAFTKTIDAANVDIEFVAKVNCQFPTIFRIPTSDSGIGWKQNAIALLSNYTGGTLGDCNRILFRGRITSLDGSIGFSNVSISMVDGATVKTRSDGTFEMIVHNGQNTLRVSNVYVNSSGNFIISIANCGFVPLFSFNEALTTCINCQERIYPINLTLAVNAESISQTSLKDNSTYSIGIGTADLAGRLSFVDLIKNIAVPSFLKRNDVLATYFQALINGPLTLEPDKKWAAFYVSKNISYSKYIDWVGDKIKYFDSSGNIITNTSGAFLVAIYIDSLYLTNVSNNFSLLSTYQFSPKDRLRILDNGDGQLFDVATFGDEIDLQVLGTNYNQAMQAAGIVPNVQNPIVNVTTAADNPAKSITLYLKYDARLDKLEDKTGFWIEIYTPQQTTEKIPYSEMEWFPVINGELAIFTGFDVSGQPTYNYPTKIDINFWDTYLFNRTINIPDVGDRFLGHPFNSPNISDDWGANLTSGGRQSTVNPNAKQLWYNADVARSDNFQEGSFINGLGLFRRENRKDFSFNPAGGIIGMIAGRNTILFICENDFFTTNYQFRFSFVNAQGLLQVNDGDSFSQPFEKVGDAFGCSPEDTGTIIAFDKFASWYDQKNASFIISDYQSAKDISDITDQEGKKYGIKSWLLKKSDFIGNWNNTHDKKSRFDVIAGVDIVRKNVMFTFRPRRRNTNDKTSYVNQRRNWDIAYQETVTYNWVSGRWIRTEGFTPEGYGTLRGSAVGVQLYSFAAGRQYAHNNLGSYSFLSFYGQFVEPVLACIFNGDKELVKVLQNFSLQSTMVWFVDLVYDSEENSYSYVPTNFVKRKENNFYAAFLRDMTSYFAPIPGNAFRSTLQDGKRIFGNYFFVRFVGDPNQLGQYRKLADIFYTTIQSPSNKK